MNELYRTFGVYRITNTRTGMTYIGKTGRNFADRWSHHRAILRRNKHSNRGLQASWNEDGESAFEFCVVEAVCDKEELNALEIKYIAQYRELGLCFNLADGGDSPYWLGRHLSDDAKKKIGEKNRKNMLGRKLPPETRKRMSIAQKQRAYSDEERALRSQKSKETNKGRVRSEETKALLRKINQENPPSAKLTPDDVRDIRRLKKDGLKLTELAEMYSTSPSYISSIVHKRRWAHID